MIPKEGAIETEKHQPDLDNKDAFYRTPWQRYGNAITGTTSVTAFLALWELTVYLGAIDPFFISSPIRIVNAASEMVMSGILWPHIMVSLTEFVLGFGLAAALAARGRSTFSELRWYPPMEAAKGSLSWVFRAKQPESVRTGP